MFTDLTKIKTFSLIQTSLYNLPPKSNEEEIDKVINLIPKSYLTQKEDLLVICRIFAYYNRNNIRNVRGNGIKLFERIMEPMKAILQDQSVFFWSIFGALNPFKQWLYEEGLITIDTIIQSALDETKNVTAEYFLPEIIEYEPTIFEKELKKRIKTPYTNEYINELKILRKKLFKWYRDSNDFNDPLYLEIEKNPLRLAIKTDNVDQFQSILSNSNLSVNSKIFESIIEQSYIEAVEESLIDYAIEYNAIKIFKYLVMNDANFTNQSTFNSICNKNYEIIHLVESNNEKHFSEYILIDSIYSWNFEITKYAIDNYDFDFLENEDIGPEKDQDILNIIKVISYTVDFQFFEKICLPFLNKNPRFIKDNIHDIIIQTFNDQSLFFTKEFLKFPDIDINFHSKIEEDKSILTKAIQLKNANAVELLLNNPNIDLENPGCAYFLPFIIVCGCGSYKKIFELFFQHPKFDLYAKDFKYQFNGLTYCILKNNFYGLRIIFDRFPDYNEEYFLDLIGHCISNEYFMTILVLLKFYFKKYNGKQKSELIENLKNHLSSDDFEIINDMIKQENL